MLRNEFWLLVLMIGSLAGCATAPPNLPACTQANSPNSICGLMNPEDIGLVPGGNWMIVSQMASRDPDAEFGAPPTRPGNLLAISAQDGERHTIFPAIVGWALDPGAVQPWAGWGDANCPSEPNQDNFEPQGIDVGRHGSGASMLAVVNHGGREAVEFFEIERGEQPAIAWRG